MNEQPSADNRVAGIVQAIQRGIRSGRYLAGQSLVERDLAADFGVSRIPVREALRRLAATGIVEIRPYRGAVVRKLSRSEAAHVVDLLNALGTLAVGRAAERIERGDHRRRLQAFLRQQRTARRQERKVQEWIDLNFPFYQLIAEISGNPFLPGLLEQFQLQICRLVADVRFSSALPVPTHDDHRAIAGEILAGRAQGALQAYHRHVAHTRLAIEALPDDAFAAEPQGSGKTPSAAGSGGAGSDSR